MEYEEVFKKQDLYTYRKTLELSMGFTDTHTRTQFTFILSFLFSFLGTLTRFRVQHTQ